MAKQLQDHPALASLEDKSTMDGQSTVGGSASGTPRASVAPAGGTKLKLTFGGGGGASSNGMATNGTVSGAGSGAD